MQDFEINYAAMRAVGEEVVDAARLGRQLLAGLSGHEGQGFSTDDAIGAANQALRTDADDIRDGLAGMGDAIVDAVAAMKRVEDGSADLAGALGRAIEGIRP